MSRHVLPPPASLSVFSPITSLSPSYSLSSVSLSFCGSLTLFHHGMSVGGFGAGLRLWDRRKKKKFSAFCLLRAGKPPPVRQCPQGKRGLWQTTWPVSQLYVVFIVMAWRFLWHAAAGAAAAAALLAAVLLLCCRNVTFYFLLL